MGWQITATTLFCEVTGEWTTILVYKDFATKCSYFSNYTKDKGEVAKEKFKACPRPSTCPLCIAYKEKIFGEETKPPKR